VRPKWTLAALSLVVVLEVLGRRAASDLGDAGGVALLWLFGSMTASLHRRDAVPWWGALSAGATALWTGLKGLFVEMGADFREDPPYPSRWPGSIVWLEIALGTLVIVLALTGSFLPGGLRWLGLHSSYTLYLLILGGLWALHLLATVCMGFVLFGLAREFADSGRREPDAEPPRWRAAAAVVGVGLVGAASVLAPPSWAMAVVAGLLALQSTVLFVPGSPRLRLLWQHQREDDPSPATIGWEGYLLSQQAVLAMCLLALVLLTRGSDVWSVVQPLEEMPVTAVLGQLLAWVGAAGYVAVTLYTVNVSYVARRRNPGRVVQAVLFVEGVDADARRRIAASPVAEAFRVRRGRRRRGDVRVRLVEERDPFGPGSDLARCDLDDPGTVDRLRRRDCVVQRRYLLRALERLFKHVSGYEFQRGSGFLVAPHLWFVSGLARDVDEEQPSGAETGTLDHALGPRYDRLMPLCARRHIYRVLRAVEVDLIFVEDGVKYKRVRDVLKRIFALYDRHDGERTVQGRDFSGIPGVRVILHDIAPENPFKVKGYPEPSYCGFGRARVLHVFRDRGGEEDPVLDDAPRERVPMLV
jgi:hypothetical protein